MGIHVCSFIDCAHSEEMCDLQRACDVFEPALEIFNTNVTLWIKYAEMELLNHQFTNARNVLNRAVAILPQTDQLWCRFAIMEETLGNLEDCRQVLERWIKHCPEDQSWQTYISFEYRHKDVEKLKRVFEQYVHAHPQIKNWIRFARLIENCGCTTGARSVYESAILSSKNTHLDERLFMAFAKFEERQGEFDRAKAIYILALDYMPSEIINKAYMIFEKIHGYGAFTEDALYNHRKQEFELRIKENPRNYDCWLDYVRFLQCEGAEVPQDVRRAFEEAIANVPVEAEKSCWEKYIDLWTEYASYEEFAVGNFDRTRNIYQCCLKLIPHKKFTFAKVWLLFAHFEVRQERFQNAREILDAAIAQYPEDELFREYIEIEIQLRDLSRCRALFIKYLGFSPEKSATWIKYGELETLHGEFLRARAIFELALTLPVLDVPKDLWKAFIKFETEQEEMERVRALYERWLERTPYAYVWKSYAHFEISISEASQGSNFQTASKARELYQRAERMLRSTNKDINIDKNIFEKQRAMMVEDWKRLESCLT